MRPVISFPFTTRRYNPETASTYRWFGIIIAALAILLIQTCPAKGQLLYRVSGGRTTCPSYILGTHHFAPPAVADSLGIWNVLDACETVTGEVDMVSDPQNATKAMMPYMLAPADSTLSRLMDSERLDSAGILLDAIIPGTDIRQFDALRPMAAIALLEAVAISRAMPDFSPQDGLDRIIQIRARNAGKKIIPLETAELQARLLFSAIPIEVQADMLYEMLKDFDNGVCQSDRLAKAYLNGDLAGMLQMTEDGIANADERAFADAILTRRNQDWLKQLPEILESGNGTLLVVGALHLAGEDGLLDGLEKLGFTIEAVNITAANRY